MSTATEQQPKRRVVKRPLVGDFVETNVGLGRVSAVRKDGRLLEIQTVRHGVLHSERAASGHWITYRLPTGATGRNGLVWLVTSIKPRNVVIDGQQCSVRVSGAIVDQGRHHDNFAWTLTEANLANPAYVFAD